MTWFTADLPVNSYLPWTAPEDGRTDGRTCPETFATTLGGPGRARYVDDMLVSQTACEERSHAPRGHPRVAIRTRFRFAVRLHDPVGSPCKSGSTTRTRASCSNLRIPTEDRTTDLPLNERLCHFQALQTLLWKPSADNPIALAHDVMARLLVMRFLTTVPRP